MRDEEQGTQNTFSLSHLWPRQTSRVDNPEERQNDYKKHQRQNQAHSGTLVAPMCRERRLAIIAKYGVALMEMTFAVRESHFGKVTH